MNGYTSFGKPVSPKDQFACHDGSKCVQIWKVFDGTSDCPDGSDEIPHCQGKSDCKDRIQATKSAARKTGIISRSGIQATKSNEVPVKYEYICKSLDERVKMSEYCDGKEDCDDGSDEE